MNKQDTEMSIRVLNNYKKESNTPHIIAGCDFAISALEEKLTNGWIPVSEPPTEYGIYIVAWMPTGHTADDIMKATKSKATHYYEMLEYDPEEDDGWEEIKQYDSYKILAWRNLPEPYKEDIDERD